MNDLCTSCGKAQHHGGCKLVTTKPLPPTDAELQTRLAYLKSDEWKREREASLAGRNPNPAIDWKARAEAMAVALAAARLEVERLTSALRRRKEGKK